MKNKNGKVALNDDLLDKVSGGGDGLYMVYGDLDTCPLCGEHGRISFSQIDGNLITYYCGACEQTITLFDQG